ncbi:unnamed protein product [Cuscuta epithymum]|uniref:Polygalacturonase n=1 Tax=Cuscuta epithymum TaxID=186058 RepID=A0AAV0EUR8_9ASTE|nr:unnamed protein product [Cuscuta epithymum]
MIVTRNMREEMSSRLGVFVLYVILAILFLVVNAKEHTPPKKFFNVLKYGAVADGITDNKKAFVKAWSDACNHSGRSRVLIPKGKGAYKLGSVTFSGPCRAHQMAFLIKGTIKAPTDWPDFDTDTWIAFNYVSKLVVKGGGYLDGQGQYAWSLNDCASNSRCPALPATLRFNFVNKSRITHLRSINSKNTHIHIFASHKIKISQVRLTAPSNSPNTDGIKIGSSTGIRISRSIIQTGDDCIAMVAGSKNIRVSQVTCGPGHGISIGSIGKNVGEVVSDVHVTNCTFVGTDNGARIKTWAPSNASLVSDILFAYIFMKDVRNPIFIDQHYCPSHHCTNLRGDDSKVGINNVTFKNIWGTSTSKIALALDCSALVPCKNINIVDINLRYFRHHGGPARSSCSNVFGQSSGKQIPSGCL